MSKAIIIAPVVVFISIELVSSSLVGCTFIGLHLMRRRGMKIVTGLATRNDVPGAVVAGEGG